MVLLRFLKHLHKLHYPGHLWEWGYELGAAEFHGDLRGSDRQRASWLSHGTISWDSKFHGDRYRRCLLFILGMDCQRICPDSDRGYRIASGRRYFGKCRRNRSGMRQHDIYEPNGEHSGMWGRNRRLWHRSLRLRFECAGGCDHQLFNGVLTGVAVGSTSVSVRQVQLRP